MEVLGRYASPPAPLPRERGDGVDRLDAKPDRLVYFSSPPLPLGEGAGVRLNFVPLWQFKMKDKTKNGST